MLSLLALAAFLLVTPRFVSSKLGVDEYRAFHTKPAPAWKGRLEIWHVATFRTYQGSVTSYLQSRADAYCRTRAGIDIDVVGLTEKKLNDRLLRGAYPSAYSFQTGMLYAEQLAPIEITVPGLRGNLAPAMRDGDVLAAPYLVSGYFLAGNEFLMQKHGFSMPEAIDAAFFSAVLGYQGAKTPQLEAPVLLLAQYGVSGSLAEAGAFLSGKAAFAVLDARALFAAQNDQKANLSIVAAPLSPFTDEVFYIGASRLSSEEERRALAGFVSFLLTDDEQRRLSVIGALPVINPGDEAYSNANCEKLDLALAFPVSPDPFLFARHKSALLSEGERALCGDAEAQKAFLQRLSEATGVG